MDEGYVSCPRMARGNKINGRFIKLMCRSCHYYRDSECKYRELYNPRYVKIGNHVS